MIKMTTSQKVISKFDEIVNAVQLLDNSRFIQLGDSWVYPEPLKSKREVRGCTDSEGFIVNLNFPEQLYLDQRIADVLGVKIRHGSLRENFNAAYSEKTKEYKEKTLVPYWVYTGEIARKQDNKIDLRRALGVKFVDRQISKPSNQTFIDENGKEILVVQVQQIQYVVGQTLQTEMPTRRGYFDDFKVVPTDKDLKSRGKGYWVGTYFDSDGFSVVGSLWGSVKGVLGAGSPRPSYRSLDGVLPIWTGENPKK